MSDYQARIALARDAYQATQPTAQQLAAGTVRVQAQLANPANHMRRLLQFLGGGALLGAGLFAAVSSTPNEGVQAAALGSVGQTEAAPSQPSAGSAKLGLPQGWLQPMQVDSDAPSADVGTAGPAAAVPPEVRGARPLPKDPAREAKAKTGSAASDVSTPPDWSQVSAALAAGDSDKADRVLQGLATNGDADTRAKALLGQAQLALSRGDRAEAKRLTRAAASVPGASQAVKDKALRWAARASL